MTVDQVTVDQFERDGAVCVRSAVELHWLETLARGVERNLRDKSPDGCEYTKEGAPGRFVDDYCNWRRISEYRDFIFNSGVGAIAAALMGSPEARIFHEHVLVKEPGTSEVSPWHQDLPYYGVNGNQLCSVWLPLDPVPQSACPEFVAGSHRWGKMFAPLKFMDHRPYDSALDCFEPVPDIESNRSDYRILSWELAPSDCIVFHMRTVHGAPGTTGLTTRRRAFSTRWLGSDAVFDQRPFTTSPPFPELNLEPGQSMRDDELFPVIWPR